MCPGISGYEMITTSVAIDLSSLHGISGDFDGSSSSSILLQSQVVTSVLGISGYNPKSISGRQEQLPLVKTEENCEFYKSALDRLQLCCNVLT